MHVQIRELTSVSEVLELEPMVLEFFRIVCGHLKKDFDVSMPPSEPTSNMMATPEKFVLPQGRGFVAEHDGMLMGMIFLKPQRPPKFEIKRLYLRTEARGLGVGKQLVRHVIAVARSLGASDLYLDSIPSLKEAVSLYEGEGFQHVGPYSGSEIASYDMLRDLGVYMHLSLNSKSADTKS
ncbi:MAG: GNAT family N-acetyltransferase [Silicimonas sp.]|nr:GNAT family N-acetyltransferase [Silicimonas sp.]